MTAQTMRAVLLASATAAIFGGLVLEQLRGPAAVSCTLARHTHHGPGADDQQAADVAIALFDDAGLPLATATAMGARREPEPGGKVSSRSEERDVRNSSGDCARHDRADARDRRKPTACRVARCQSTICVSRRLISLPSPRSWSAIPCSADRANGGSDP
jgi:hypothetical protein